MGWERWRVERLFVGGSCLRRNDWGDLWNDDASQVLFVDFSFLGKVEVDHVLQAMHDGRVKRALARALFDAKVRRDYRELRAQGKLVPEAVETLAAPLQ